MSHTGVSAAIDGVADVLSPFEARTSTDPVKTDLELTCLNCGAVVCDVEHGDTLDVLVRTAADHRCNPKEGGSR